MSRGSTICATDPNDPCCYSCWAAPPNGCAADPACSTATLPTDEDEINLRCFDQKRRFGFETLYPVARYVNALTQPFICPANSDLRVAGCPDDDADGAPDVANNPLFEPGADSGVGREPSMVQFLGIVGVPFQNVAATVDANGDPLPADVLRFRTASDLEDAALWPSLVGDSSASPPVPPTEPLMIESIDPRTGTSATGEALAVPTAGYLANSVNGHEWVPVFRDDLQFSCIYPLPVPRDCTLPENQTGCECGPSFDPLTYNPVCQAADGSYGSMQRFAKAYPGLRHLELMQSLGPNAVVASICARNVDDESASDFGFRPAIASALEQWKARLAGP
jgi:hypothetical protein